MKTRGCSVGIDLGGTNLKFCVADENGSILSRHRVSTPSGGGCDAIIDAIVANIPVLLSESGIPLSQIDSIGLGVPGSVDPERGVIVFAPNIFAVNVDVLKAIGRHFDIPIHLAQDSQAAAWAEYVAGAGRGLNTVITVTLGTGIGCGIVMGGKIYRGSLNHTAGELGHQIVEVNGRECNCGRRGCLEAYAAGLAIVREAKESIPGLDSLLGKSANAVSVKDVFELAQHGNRHALRITGQVVNFLGLGFVSLVNLLSPDLITVSGGICDAPAELLFDPLVDFVRRNAYPTVSHAVKISRSSLGGDAPLIGVATLHRQSTPYTAGVETG